MSFDQAHLPEWYPLADATYGEIDGWLASGLPPYDEMRLALPWLTSDRQLQEWLGGFREARSLGTAADLNNAFPALAAIPLPPRRIEGRQA